MATDYFLLFYLRRYDEIGLKAIRVFVVVVVVLCLGFNLTKYLVSSVDMSNQE